MRALIAALDSERQSLAFELHGGIAQELALVKLLLDKALESPADRAQSYLKEAQSLLTRLFEEVLNLSRRLQHGTFNDLGLLPALKWHFEHYTARTGIRIRLRHSGISKQLPHEVGNAAYHIILEALDNMTQSGTGEVILTLRGNQKALHTHLESRGCGFDPAQSPGSLIRMRGRALALGGRLEIESAPGLSATITCELPFPH